MKLRLRTPKLQDLALTAAFIAIAFAILLGVCWLGWQIWMLAVGAFFPGAPDHVARPGYWAFGAAWLLAGLIGTTLFGRVMRRDD